MVVKIIDKESGVVLKDNPEAGKNGGATWAYEVAGQTMVCPIIIEDLSPPGQMLVEVKKLNFKYPSLPLSAAYADNRLTVCLLKIFRCFTRNVGFFWR
jgi:hypothetical protein